MKKEKKMKLKVAVPTNKLAQIAIATLLQLLVDRVAELAVRIDALEKKRK